MFYKKVLEAMSLFELVLKVYKELLQINLNLLKESCLLFPYVILFFIYLIKKTDFSIG